MDTIPGRPQGSKHLPAAGGKRKSGRSVLKTMPMRSCRPLAVLLVALMPVTGAAQTAAPEQPRLPAETRESPGSADGRSWPDGQPPLSRPSILPARPEAPQAPKAPGGKSGSGASEAPYERGERKAPDEPGEPASPAMDDRDAVPMAPGPESGSAGLRRAQFNSAMARVDGTLARLSPAVRRTVGALAQLAWGRAALRGTDAARTNYEVSRRRRELALERQQLAATARLIDRWRGGVAPPQGTVAAIPPGLHRRDQEVTALRRSIACGHRYAALVEWMAQHGGTTPSVRQQILSGC
jgi:hypothetical protein